MTRASELLALAARVEAAQGADRMLDLDVWRAVCPGAAELEARGKQPLPWLWCVTTSLDAAIEAFLRALPPEFNALVRFDSGNVDPVFFAEDWELLAAAVTRAAQEDKR
jgi:hypothetical protein